MTPEDGPALAAALAAASRDRRQTVIRGGGTKIDWGRPAPRVDVEVSTARLDRLIAHRYGDLTATVQCGMTLKALNAALRTHGQRLPVESAFDAATIGGIVATNDAGPLRHRHGTPRDLVIGITLALTDGRVVKAGGTVVKNVAGYDLGKLVSGSHGTLAGIVDVTFKLVPIPQASATLVVKYSDPVAFATDIATLWGSQVEPECFDLRVEDGTYTLLVRMATSPAATDAQIAAARAMVTGQATVVTGVEEAAAWDAQVRGPWEADAASPERAERVEAAVVRLSWLPTSLPDVLKLLGNATLIARALGTGFVRLGGSPQEQAAAIARFRASTNVGNVVVLRGSPALKAAIDVWGPPRDSDRVAHALKHSFDPAGILNAGRGPI